jgi:calcineurin-like phosphoesterase family protein
MSLFVISDLHLYHRNFLRGERIGIRSQFGTLDEMHEAIVDGWNSVVKPKDKVYMLGDLTLERPSAGGKSEISPLISDRFMALCVLVGRLHGTKWLFMGNHDYWNPIQYMQMGFERVLATETMDGAILSHVPIHPGQLGRFKGNIHGHTHTNNVTSLQLEWDYEAQWDVARELPDTRYLNVCVEPLNYIPMAFEDAKKRLA